MIKRRKNIRVGVGQATKLTNLPPSSRSAAAAAAAGAAALRHRRRGRTVYLNGVCLFTGYSRLAPNALTAQNFRCVFYASDFLARSRFPY